MVIFIVNHKIKNCGVYQYGKRVALIASKSKLLNIHYIEADNQLEFQSLVDKYKPSVIVYNHLTGTMPWVNADYVELLRKRGIKQGTIVHNVAYSTFFDFYLHQDPNFKTSKNNYKLLRPLFQYNNNINLQSNQIKIGSFGFGFFSKYYNDLCSYVRDSFINSACQIQLRLHLTHSHFCENSKDIEIIKHHANQIISNSNISLNITTNFISDDELLDFLAGNHINIFFYQKYNDYNGISSSIDYALSVKRPIAICKSNMFSHIWNANPSICVEDTSLNEIINNGFKPLECYYNEWSHENFIKIFEQNINNIINE